MLKIDDRIAEAVDRAANNHNFGFVPFLGHSHMATSRVLGGTWVASLYCSSRRAASESLIEVLADMKAIGCRAAGWDEPVIEFAYLGTAAMGRQRLPVSAMGECAFVYSHRSGRLRWELRYRPMFHLVSATFDGGSREEVVHKAASFVQLLVLREVLDNVDGRRYVAQP